MIKTIARIVFGFLILTSFSALGQSPCVPVYGDLNSDGVVNSTDMAILANYLAGNNTLTPIQLLAADVRYDGVINVSDLMTMAQFLAGNITSLPVIPN